MRVTKDISVYNHQGGVRFRVAFSGYEKFFKLGIPYDDTGLERAKMVAHTIQEDIDGGRFDYSLKRYQHTFRPHIDPLALFALWDRWVDSQNLRPDTIASHHDYIRKMILESNARLNDSSWFVRMGQSLSPTTYNQRLSYLRTFYNWLIGQGITRVNHFDKVQPMRNTMKRVQPFTTAEVTAILKAFRDNRFCSPKSKYKHSIYYPFTYFLFKSGCRTSEAIGLRIRDVDFVSKRVCISSALVRESRTCSTGTRRVRKAPKTVNSVRNLPLTLDLEELLKPICTGRHPDDLVFTSATGLPIDDRNYRNRYWKPVLAGLGIEYRKPYTTRHTSASMALTQGSTIHEVAAMLGHSDPTLVLNTYGHLLHDIRLPNFEEE